MSNTFALANEQIFHRDSGVGSSEMTGQIVPLIVVHGLAPFGGAGSFLAIMLTEMIGFGSFVALGINYRHRTQIHRPMMLLATTFIISGALGRCPYIGNLAVIPPLYVYLQ